MKVILKQDIKGKGKKGQMIEAAEGYARNYLIPLGVAVPATADAVYTMKLRDKAKAKADAEAKAAATEIAEKLKGLQVKVSSKGGEGGKLFGAVTGREIAAALKEQHGVDIDSKENLIACQMTIPEICSHIGADTLGYLSVEGVQSLATPEMKPQCGFCTACFTGDYPIEVPKEMPKDKFEKKIGE